MTGAFLTLLLAAIVALALIAKRMRVPYPIVFVLGGIALALVPAAPQVELKPDLVFLLFLPPLIFGDGWTTDVRAFMRYRQPIFLLATGLVAATSIGVAYAAQALIGLPLAVGFVLGAVLSPTDAVATDAIAEEVGLPQRIATIISGESLVNDATGLVIYNFAVVAVLTGTFSLLLASVQFVYVVVVGIAVGIGIAWLVAKLQVMLRQHALSDTVMSVAISLVIPFAVYVPATALGGSGVLAAAAAGMYLSRKSSEIFDAESRISVASIWNFLFFAFNGAAFVLIGLQLPAIVRALHAEHFPTSTLIWFSIAIAVIVVLLRYVWVFPVARVRRLIDRTIARREGPNPPWTWTFVLGTAGMRGIVSLAAALAIPDTVAPGVPFPYRNLILFTTFVVIVVTLVGEGLLLPVLIRKLGVVEPEGADATLALARVRTAEAALARLRSLEVTFESTVEWEVVGRLQSEYGQRVDHFTVHLRGGADDADTHEHLIEGRLRREAFDAERRALGELRRSGEITDDVYRWVQWQIDLAESRLARLQSEA